MSARLTLKFGIGGAGKYAVPFDDDLESEDQVAVFEYSKT